MKVKDSLNDYKNRNENSLIHTFEDGSTYNGVAGNVTFHTWLDSIYNEILIDFKINNNKEKLTWFAGLIGYGKKKSSI